MDDRQTILVSGSLTSRIEQLEIEERDAVRRRDWSTARGIAQERAALKEAYHRALARRQGIAPTRNRDGGRCG
jgi:hypothetical protein